MIAVPAQVVQGIPQKSRVCCEPLSDHHRRHGRYGLEAVGCRRNTNGSSVNDELTELSIRSASTVFFT